MVKTVRQLGDPVLREKAKRVSNLRGRRDISALVVDLVDTMFTYGGIGIAAPQIGVPLRVIIVGNRHGTVMVNPEILESKGEIIQVESCLSIPGYAAEVTRPETIKVKWQTERGVDRRAVLTGEMARIAQHEIDHLNGILFIDHVKPEAEETT